MGNHEAGLAGTVKILYREDVDRVPWLTFVVCDVSSCNAWTSEVPTGVPSPVQASHPVPAE